MIVPHYSELCIKSGHDKSLFSKYLSKEFSFSNIICTWKSSSQRANTISWDVFHDPHRWLPPFRTQKWLSNSASAYIIQHYRINCRVYKVHLKERDNTTSQHKNINRIRIHDFSSTQGDRASQVQLPRKRGRNISKWFITWGKAVWRFHPPCQS